MAGNLTDAAELLLLDWLNIVGSPSRPTAPLMVRLVTANGTDAAAGTEVSGGSYAPVAVTMTAAASGGASNVGVVSFPGMPACTVVGVELWDSAGTPVRLWYAPLAVSKTLNTGDTFQIDVGDLVTGLD